MATKAHKAVRVALLSGKLVRQPCSACGSVIGVQGHHDDYSKPLEVTWLCGACHRQKHGKRN
jgi:ribosomal protein S27AE